MKECPSFLPPSLPPGRFLSNPLCAPLDPVQGQEEILIPVEQMHSQPFNSHATPKGNYTTALELPLSI